MASDPTAYHQLVSKSYGVDGSKSNQSIRVGGADNSSVYASSAENISRLLEGWMRSSPLQPNNNSTTTAYLNSYADFEKLLPTDHNAEASSATAAVIQCYRPQKMEQPTTHQDLEGILMSSFHHHTAPVACDKSSCDSSQKGSESSTGLIDQEKAKIDNNPPLSFLEKWLLDESAGQVEGVMELPPIF